MSERMALSLPPVRDEREITLDTMAAVGDVARPLTLFERISNITLVRRLLVLALLAIAWEGFARYTQNPLLFPSFRHSLKFPPVSSPYKKPALKASPAPVESTILARAGGTRMAWPSRQMAAPLGPIFSTGRSIRRDNARKASCHLRFFVR